MILSLISLSQTLVLAGDSKPTYEMVDGYFYKPGAKPIHLVHNFDKYYLGRGDELDLHIDLKLKVGLINPCTDKEEDKCKFQVSFIEKDTTGKEAVVSSKYIERYFGEQMGFGWDDKVPRGISGDEAIVRVTVIKNSNEYFRFDIPIVVN